MYISHETADVPEGVPLSVGTFGLTRFEFFKVLAHAWIPPRSIGFVATIDGAARRNGQTGVGQDEFLGLWIERKTLNIVAKSKHQDGSTAVQAVTGGFHLLRWLKDLRHPIGIAGSVGTAFENAKDRPCANARVGIARSIQRIEASHQITVEQFCQQDAGLVFWYIEFGRSGRLLDLTLARELEGIFEHSRTQLIQACHAVIATICIGRLLCRIFLRESSPVHQITDRFTGHLHGQQETGHFGQVRIGLESLVEETCEGDATLSRCSCRGER